jgi:hypothetical protein
MMLLVCLQPCLTTSSPLTKRYIMKWFSKQKKPNNNYKMLTHSTRFWVLS